MRARLTATKGVISPKSGAAGVALEFTAVDGSTYTKSLWFSGGATEISQRECDTAGLTTQELVSLTANWSPCGNKPEVDLRDDGKGSFYINGSGAFGKPVEAANLGAFRAQMAAQLGVKAASRAPAAPPPDAGDGDYHDSAHGSDGDIPYSDQF